MQNPPPSDRYAEVKEKYEGTQFRVEPTISTYYFWMNTEKAPFDDVKVRQAVNYAVDSDGAGTDLRRLDQRHPADPAAGDAGLRSNSTSTRTTWQKPRK